MSNFFPQALQRISEVVMFENWLRFYFITDENNVLSVRLPEKAMEQLKSNYPTLVGLAEKLNNQEIDHKRSLDSVCLFVASEIDGIAIPEATIAQVFDSPLFHLELQLFSSWVQAHENQLDESFMEFSTWQQMFATWKESDQVKEYVQTIADASKRTAEGPIGTTQ